MADKTCGNECGTGCASGCCDKQAHLDGGGIVLMRRWLVELRGLDNQKVITPGTVDPEARKQELVSRLASNLLTHADELLTCWEITHREYAPLASALVPLIDRVIMGRQAQAQTQPVDNAFQP